MQKQSQNDYLFTTTSTSAAKYFNRFTGIFFLIFLVDHSPVASSLLIGDTAVFKDQQQVSISESILTLVTDVLLQDAGNAVTALDKH